MEQSPTSSISQSMEEVPWLKHMLYIKPHHKSIHRTSLLLSSIHLSQFSPQPLFLKVPSFLRANPPTLRLRPKTYDPGGVSSNAISYRWQSYPFRHAKKDPPPTGWALWQLKNPNQACLVQSGVCMEVGWKIDDEVSKLICRPYCPIHLPSFPTIFACNNYRCT